MKIQFVADGQEVGRLNAPGEPPPRIQDIVFVGETSYVVVDVEWAAAPGMANGWTGARVHLRELSDAEIEQRLSARRRAG